MKLRVNCLIIRMCVDRLLSANRTEFISFFLNIRFHIYASPAFPDGSPGRY